MKRLVDASTGRAVQVGEIVPSFRGEGMFYAGLSRGDTMVLARRPRQDGRVVRPSDLCGEYYPTVFPNFEIKEEP